MLIFSQELYQLSYRAVLEGAPWSGQSISSGPGVGHGADDKAPGILTDWGLEAGSGARSCVRPATFGS